AMACASWPSFWIAATWSFSLATERDARMVRAPAAAMCCAIAKPIPRLAPAIRAVFPVSENIKSKRLLQMHRLGEGAVSGGIPGGEAHPFLARRIERDAETVRAERRDVRGGEDLPVRAVTVAPDEFDELGRERPLHFGVERARCARPFQAVAFE